MSVFVICFEKILKEAIYTTKPYPAYAEHGNFVLKGEDALYLFYFDLGRRGSANVVAAGAGTYHGATCFGNVTDKIQAIKWIDNDEELEFCQNGDNLLVNAGGFRYGFSTCVRVAKATLEK